MLANLGVHAWGTGRKLTVACNHQELIILGQIVHNNIGVGGNDLLLGSELCALLEFEVANGPGKGKVSVDASEIDESAGSGDSCLFTYT